MDYQYPNYIFARMFGEMLDLLCQELGKAAESGTKAFLATGRHGHRLRLKPGPQTPMWNKLARQIQPHLSEYGDQVNLGRLVGLPRQRIHTYFVKGTDMPDAERTLQFLVWMMLAEQGRRLT